MTVMREKKLKLSAFTFYSLLTYLIVRSARPLRGMRVAPGRRVFVSVLMCACLSR